MEVTALSYKDVAQDMGVSEASMNPGPEQGNPYQRSGEGAFNGLISDPGPKHMFSRFLEAPQPVFIFCAFCNGFHAENSRPSDSGYN